MKNLFKKIWIPAILVGVAAIQSFGIDAARAVKMSRITDSLGHITASDSSTIIESIDSEAIPTSDTLLYIPSNPGMAAGIKSLFSAVDSVRNLTARDTIIVPDSLRHTDSVRYRYYVELIDTKTRRQTRDSLIAAGDSIQLSALDSIFFKDSTEKAYRDSLIWFNGLPRKEQKKVKTLQELPAMLSLIHI